MKPRTLIFTGEGKGKTTAAFGLVLRAAGHGQRVLVVQFAAQRKTANEALVFAQESVASGKYDLIVLDEICGAIARELIDEEEVIHLLTMPARRACIVLTGRHASKHLMSHADTVTEMRCISHGYTEGIVAQEGVEF